MEPDRCSDFAAGLDGIDTADAMYELLVGREALEGAPQQDPQVPFANIHQMMGATVGPGVKMGRDAKKLVQAIVTEITGFITSEAEMTFTERPHRGHGGKKSISSSDIQNALDKLGLGAFSFAVSRGDRLLTSQETRTKRKMTDGQEQIDMIREPQITPELPF